MATGQKIDDLFISLGLDLRQLDLDFATADKTVKQTISRLNSEATQVKLKTDIDTAKLDAAGKVTEQLKARQEGLNKVLEIQRQKVAILGAVYQQTAAEHGKESAVSRRAETALLREQKAAASLEAELKNLTRTKKEAANVPVTNTANAKIAALQGNMQTALGYGQTMAAGGMGALAMSAISKIGPIGLGVGALAGTLYGMTQLSKKAIDTGNEIYMLKLKLHTTTEEAEKLHNMFRLADVSLEGAIPAFIRLNKQITSTASSTNDTVKMLNMFGVNLKDSKGNLLPYTEQLRELAAGYEKASKAGMVEAYVAQVLGGRGASLVSVLRDYKGVSENADMIKTALINPEEAHKLADEWETMEIQLKHAGASFSMAFLPVAEAVLPLMIEGLAGITTALNDNKESVKQLSIAFGDLTKIGGSTVGVISEIAGKVNNELDYLGVGVKSKMNELTKFRWMSDKHPFLAAGAAAVQFAMPVPVKNPFLNFYDEEYQEYLKEFKKENEDSEKVQEDMKEFYTKQMQAMRETKINDDISNLKYALKNENNPQGIKLKEQLTAIEQEKAAALEAGASEEKANELANLKKQKAQRDYTKSVQDANKQVADSYYNLTHSSLESSLLAIDRQAEAWKRQGIEENLIVQNSEAAKAKIYQDFTDNTLSKIDDAWKSNLQKRLDDIEREKRAYIQKGVDEVKATQWAEQQKHMTMQQQAQQALKENKEYFDIVKNALYDETIPANQRVQAAKLGVLQRMREKSGIAYENITPDMLRIYSEAMNFGENNLIKSLATDPLAKMADSSAIQTIRGSNISFQFNVGNVVTPDSAGMKYLVDTTSGQIINTIKPYIGGAANGY